MPFGRCWRLFQKIPAYVQICSNCLCPFTSRSRLFALTTDLPGPADGTLNIVQGNNSLASWSQNQNPFRMSEGDESDGNLGVLLIRTLDDTRYSSRIAISWCSCLATSRWWWIQNRSSISYLTKFPRCWRFFRKILAYIQNFPCPFTSRSRLFALTTDLPGTADGPLNIVQGNILASWSQNPFRISEGDESDGNLGVLLIRTLDDTRYWSEIAISWCSCLATSRWWWIYTIDHRYHISQNFPGVEEDHGYIQNSHALSPRDPDCSHWPLICQKWKNAGHILAVQLHMTDISSGWVNGDHCGLDGLLNGPCESLRDLWTDLSHHFINGVHPSQASLQSTAFSWQESQYHKYCTILYLFQWQGPYRYCVRLEGCSGGVGAHCTTPAGDDQHSWRSVATPTASTWKWTDQCPNNTVTAYRSSRNGKTRQTQRLGCLAQISTAPKSEY